MHGGTVALASNKLDVLDEVKSRASPVGGKPTAVGQLASVVRLTWVILIQYLIRSLMRIETNRACFYFLHTAACMRTKPRENIVCYSFNNASWF